MILKKKRYPGFQLLEINDSIVGFHTDFSLKKQISNLQVLEGEILHSKNEKFAKYKVVHFNLLKLFIDGKSNGKEAVFECDFYRLEPTITTLKKQILKK